MKDIILIDNRFPLPGGEPFLNNEMGNLISTFDNVYIIPTTEHSCSEDDINISDTNVTVMQDLPCASTFTKLAIYFSCLFCKSVWNEIIYLHKVNKINLRNVKRMINVWQLSEYKSIKAYDWLSKHIPLGDNIIVYSYWSDVNLVIAAKICKRFKHSKLISRAHGHDLYLERNDGYIPFRKYVFDSADYIYAISKQGLEYLKEKWPVWVSKFKLSYLGTRNHNTGKSSSDGILRIVSCSNMVKLKRIELIIDSLSILPDVKFEWHHFGDGVERERIQKYAKKQLNSNQYHFHGLIENELLMSWYVSNPVDLFLNVSETEGLPVSIMEAMSFGIPVIATNVGGTNEIVVDNYNGFLVDRDFEVTQLADLIRYFTKIDSRAVLEIREKARRTWEHNFNSDVNFAVFYNELKLL